MGVFNEDLLFIHIPKTGGTAIKSWLWDNLPNAQGQGRKGDASGLPIGHVPLRDIEHYTGRSPSSFKRIIGIIRNPYSQQLSQWRFWRERYAIGDRHEQDMCAASHPELATWLQDPGCDFHMWYEQRWAASEPQRLKPSGVPKDGYEGFGGYYRYWLTVGDLIPPNVHIVKLEELARGWPKAVDGFVPDPHAPIPRENAGPSRPYPVEWYYHDAGARRLVEDKFRWAFEHHYPRYNVPG